MTRLIHVGIHQSRNKNAGDTLLFEEVRRAFDTAIPGLDWSYRQLWDPLDLDEAASFGESADGLVVGGGGLLLRDQKGSDTSASGWQWNTAIDAVRAIDVPLFVFAIGYNRFRAQADFEPGFAEHITAVVEKSAFFGLRNSGSIRALKKYLPASVHEKLSRQPCPTTVLNHLHPELANQRRERPPGRVLRFNVAFDRPEMRFGKHPDNVLTELANAIRHASQSGWEVVVTCHKTLDLQILPYLDGVGTKYVVQDLTAASPTEITAAYRDCDLAVGLRGHAQMIPFGVGTPIISIISHDKMAWFLEDIGHPGWGVEIEDPALVEKATALIDRVGSMPEAYASALDSAQAALWDLTSTNLHGIRSSLNQNGPVSSKGPDES